MKKITSLVLSLGVLLALSFTLLGCDVIEENNEPSTSETTPGQNDNEYLTEGDEELPYVVLEGTIVAVLEEELLFIEGLNLSLEDLEAVAESWLADTVGVYRLTGVDSPVEVGTEIRVSFAITTFSAPPLAIVESYEIISR